MVRPVAVLAIALLATACGSGRHEAPPATTAAATTARAATTAPAPAATDTAPATTEAAPASTEAAPATTAPGAPPPTGTEVPPITTSGETPVPDDLRGVVLAWSAAINRNDNDAAADLFAKDAVVAQSSVFKLVDKATAVLWNDGLPCAGTVVELRMVQTAVVATFVLGERPKHQCDAPGHRAGAAFVIEHGKITLWQQVPVPDATPTAPAPAPTTTGSGPVA
jgi:limonene-1,2-epoxide hydrolase